MPLKIMILITMLSVIGVGLALWLLKKSFSSPKYCFLFLGLCISAWSLCYIYLPCFPYIHSEVVCEAPDHQIALTFDDGPNSPYTDQILDILKKEHIQATFFTLSKYMNKNPLTVKRILEEGHALGNHGATHTPLALKRTYFIESEIASWENAAESSGGGVVLPYKIFRASHGWKNPWLISVLKEKGYSLIGWNVGVWDSDKPGKEMLLERLKKQLKPGAIILLHDGDGDVEGGDRSQTVDVLPDLIRECRQRGYQFVTIPQMLE